MYHVGHTYRIISLSILNTSQAWPICHKLYSCLYFTDQFMFRTKIESKSLSASFVYGKYLELPPPSGYTVLKKTCLPNTFLRMS